MDKIYVGIDPGGGKRTGIATYNKTQKTWMDEFTREAHQDVIKSLLTQLVIQSRTHFCWSERSAQDLLETLYPLTLNDVKALGGVFEIFGVQTGRGFLLTARQGKQLFDRMKVAWSYVILRDGALHEPLYYESLFCEPVIDLVIRVEDTSSNQQLYEHRMTPIKELLGLMSPAGLQQVYDGQHGPRDGNVQEVALGILSHQISQAVRYLNRISNNVGMNGQISRDIQYHLQQLKFQYEPIIPSDPSLNSEEMEVLTGLKTKKSHSHIRSAAGLISDVVEHDISDRYFGKTTKTHPREKQIKQAMLKSMVNLQAKERKKRERGH